MKHDIRMIVKRSNFLRSILAVGVDSRFRKVYLWRGNKDSWHIQWFLGCDTEEMREPSKRLTSWVSLFPFALRSLPLCLLKSRDFQNRCTPPPWNSFLNSSTNVTRYKKQANNSPSAPECSDPGSNSLKGPFHIFRAISCSVASLPRFSSRCKVANIYEELL